MKLTNIMLMTLPGPFTFFAIQNLWQPLEDIRVQYYNYFVWLNYKQSACVAGGVIGCNLIQNIAMGCYTNRPP